MSRPEKLRVVTLLDTVAVGGAERLAVLLATHLDMERFAPMVCVSRRPRQHPVSTQLAAASLPLAAELESASVPVVRLNRSKRLALWQWKPLLDLLRAQEVHVLHSHKFGSNVWAAMLGRLARVPVIVAHEHGSERDRLHYALDRTLIARRVDALVAVSEAEQKYMIDVEHVPPEKVRLIRNGIEPLPPASIDLRRELGIGPGIPVLGTLAVLRPEKALDVLIAAAARLLPRFPDLQLVIAGIGPEEHRLRTLVHELSLENRTHLIGFRSDIENVLAALDVVVFSSDREAMPLATIEAMAAGKPIVATAVGGIPELLRDGVDGLLVPPRSPDAIAAAVARLLDDPTLAARLGSEAAERQLAELDIRRTTEAVERLYDELYAEKSRGRSR